MTTEQQFFNQLLVKTKEAFNKSPISEKQPNIQWNYSICGTPIQKDKGIILGINWGADGSHEPQSEMPDSEEAKNYPFIKRSKPFFKEYLQLDINSINFNYTNLCFFRTPKANDLSLSDYKISLPLFKEFVKFVNPNWIFSLGNSNYTKLIEMGELTLTKDNQFYDKDQKHYGVSSNLWGHSYFSVPHPNARVKTNSRNEIWKQIGEQFISLTK